MTETKAPATDFDLDAYTETVRAQVVAAATSLRGIDWIFERDPDEVDEQDDANDDEDDDAAIVKGLIFSACRTIIDQLFDDAAHLNVSDVERADAVMSSSAIVHLPERFAPHYSPEFVRKFLVATVDVSNRLANGWGPLTCVAEELALRLILEEASMTGEACGIKADDGWINDLEDFLFEDTDYIYLFEDESAAADPNRQYPGGMASQKFEDWFAPFRDSDLSSPYASPDAAPIIAE